MENEIKQVIILQDFIKLLHFIEENEAKLTATGNFNLKTIANIATILRLPDYVDEKHPIRSEYEWAYLEYLDVLGQITKLTINRKRCRRLSKNGKEYLKRPSYEQFLLLFEAYWKRLHWAFLFPYSGNDNPAYYLRDQQHFVLRVMWEKRREGKWINFKEFAEYLRVELDLKIINYLGQDLPTRVYDCIEMVIIKQFETFRLIEVRYKIERKYDYDFKEIDCFRLTDLGKKVLVSLLFPEEMSDSRLDQKLC